MNRDFDNQSDKLNTSELEKCFLGRKQLPKEKFKYKEKKNFTQSQVSKLAHVIYPTIIIDDDNLKRNLCFETVQLAQKRHLELKKMLKSMIDSEKTENHTQMISSQPVQVIELISSENSNSITEKNGSECGDDLPKNLHKAYDTDREKSSESSARDVVMKIAPSVSPQSKFKQIDMNIKEHQGKKQLQQAKKNEQNYTKDKLEQDKSFLLQPESQKMDNASTKVLKKTKDKSKNCLNNSNDQINHPLGDLKDKDKNIPATKPQPKRKDHLKDETHSKQDYDKNLSHKGTKVYNQNESEKVLKNKTLNTTKKYQLGVLEQKSISNAEALNIPFLTDDEAVTFHYYSIEIFKKEKYIEGKLFQTREDLSSDEAFGIITQENYGVIPNFKLLIPIVINEKSYNVEHIKITYVKSRKIKKKSFSSFATFHHKLFDDLYCRKENIVEDLDRLIRTECEERRYMVLPLKRDQKNSQWEIDGEKMNLARRNSMKEFSYSKSVPSVFSEIKEATPSLDESQYRKKLHEILKSQILFTDYNYNLYYYQQLFFMDEPANKFFERTAEVAMDRLEENEVHRRESHDLVAVLKTRYFRSNDILLFDKKKTDFVVLNCETSSDALSYYRRLPEKYKLSINIKQSPFIMVLQAKSINTENFTYNCHHSLKHANHSYKQTKKKLKTEASIHSIIPMETTRLYFLNKKQWKLASKLPSILIQFERFVLVLEMISLLKLLKNPPNEFEIKHFTAALTSPAMIEDYSYEILETLGDSVLKFMVTYFLFDKFPQMSEGEISKRRNELTKNNYLFLKGSVSSLINYIYTSPFNMKNWDPPMRFKHLQKYDLTLTKKTIADVVEAVMGACFLSSEIFNSCLVYMKYIDLLNGLGDYPTKFINSLTSFDNSIFIDINLLELTYEPDISFQELYSNYSLYFEFQPQITKKTSQIKEIGVKFNKVDLDKNPLIANEILKELEEKVLHYSFNDKSLLKEALTHKSIKNEKSYERLEILGDSILEIYLISTIFHLSKQRINTDSVFNPGNLSKIKAFLSSNYFLLRLSVYFRIYEFMIISYKLGRKIEEANKYIKGINFDQRLNQYEETLFGRPKMVSDIFEALLGAILVDSNLAQCYTFLNMVLGPFVVYCAKNLGNLKYSPIAEFVEMVQEQYKKGPSFISKRVEEGQIEIQIKVDEKNLGKGRGLTEDAAKEAACLNGIKKMKKQLQEN